MTEDRHSPLGASSAERWINCPGSVAFIKKLHLPTSDEPDYRAEGKCAHAAAAHCILQRMAAWEVIGEKFENMEVTQDMAKAIQLYLDATEEMRTKADEGQGEMIVEELVSRPEVHPDMYGTLDLSYFDTPILDITDYKHGAGIAVDVEWNAQLMYYAYMRLLHYADECKNIRLRIVQPRAWHADGPVREWMITPADLTMWVEETLLPAMVKTSDTEDFLMGAHCRFCPAKLICPVLGPTARAAANADPKLVASLSDETLGNEWATIQGIKFYEKAVREEVLRRLMAGRTCTQTKLVAKKANRVWKAEAIEVLKARLGDAFYTEPEPKSPAEVEKLGSDGAALAAEWAYTPKTGLTVALETDKKPGVKIEKASEVFGPAGITYLNAEAAEIPNA